MFSAAAEPGPSQKQHSQLKCLLKAKKEAPPREKPEAVKTQLRDMVILPEMVGSMVGVYNSQTFNQVEIKAEMNGPYLGEFSSTYKPVKHGPTGIGATRLSPFISLKQPAWGQAMQHKNTSL
nr:40S ribosomal protein S15-like [Marmota flaviventris]